MAVQYGRLCSLLLSEHFGEVVGKVVENLQWGPKPLSFLVSATGLSTIKVKKALAVLIQYGFALFEPGKVQHIAEYRLLHEKILLILRYPRYISLIKGKYGNGAALLLGEVIKYGNITGSDVMLKAFKVTKEDTTKTNNEITLVTLRKSLHELITDNYLMRCAYPNVEEGQEENIVPKLTIKESELYKSPDINLKVLTGMESKGTIDNPGDNGIYWKVNFDRFHQDMRDEIMINAMRRRFDDNAAELLKYLLQLMYLRTDPWAADSNPVPLIELKDKISKQSGNGYLSQFFEQYLKLMEEDSSHFVSKTSDSSSCQVHVNLSKAFTQLTSNTIERVVDQRFGSKASRIFRLVCSLKFAEQEQIQQLAMITDKEAKQITYKLLQENFMQMQELRKPTAGTGPNKSFFLFHVDINLVVHVVIDCCHKALFNALTRRRMERQDHKRLMEKHEHVQQLKQSLQEQEDMDEEQMKELIDDYMAPPERNLLESVEKMIEKLQLAELQIDDTLFQLQWYSYYQGLTMPKLTSSKK